jgi:carboxypeptidase C (cathepsin A)
LKRSFVFFMALALAGTAPSLAAGPSGPPHPAAAEAPVVPAGDSNDSVTHHTIALAGGTLAYTARAGTLTLMDADDKPSAKMFFVAYTLDGAEPNHRPVTFLYNGGPGSSTMWLHMGSFGPVRVATADGTLTGPPPYRVVDNQATLLDRSDLVFIDMPGTGFGRISGKPSEFFGLDQDVHAFAQFIQRYITTFGRWNSPRFLFGESYGTTRSAALVDYLQQNDGIGINGVVLQSTILNFGLDNTDVGGDDWGYVLYLPTEAATAWYHKTLPNAPASLGALLPEVERFALGEYADALSKGAFCPPAEYSEVVSKLHRYLGVSEQYIRNSDLRIPYNRLESELLRGQGVSVGRLDSRFQTPSLDRVQDQPDWDPTDAAIDSAFTSSVNSYLRGTLGYTTPLLYQKGAYDQIQASGGWDFKHRGISQPDVSVDLGEALSYNPDLKIFSANGYYDFATPYFETMYTLGHLGVLPSLQKNITYGFYPSGHMIYLQPEALTSMHDDLERWYAATLAGR